MNEYSVSHFSDHALTLDLAESMSRERGATASGLARIAELDARRLYLPAAYPSMHAYCVHGLRLSEESAFKRIRAARTARRVPVIFPALAEGRINLNGVILLAPHLTEDTVEDLLTAALHKTRSEIEQLLAQRFPRPDVPLRVQPLAASPSPLLAPDSVNVQLAARPVGGSEPRPRVTPLSPERFALQMTVGRSTH